MRALVDHLLRSPATPRAANDIEGFWAGWQPELCRWQRTAHRATAGGFSADRLGFAFAAGYQSALVALVPDLPESYLTGLCATEEEGNHPRAIHTRLEPDAGGHLLSGEKRWATLAPLARELLVVASDRT